MVIQTDSSSLPPIRLVGVGHLSSTGIESSDYRNYIASFATVKGLVGCFWIGREMLVSDKFFSPLSVYLQTEIQRIILPGLGIDERLSSGLVHGKTTRMIRRARDVQPDIPGR